MSVDVMHVSLQSYMIMIMIMIMIDYAWKCMRELLKDMYYEVMYEDTTTDKIASNRSSGMI